MNVLKARVSIGSCVLVLFACFAFIFKALSTGPVRLPFESLREGMTFDEAMVATNTSRSMWSSFREALACSHG